MMHIAVIVVIVVIVIISVRCVIMDVRLKLKVLIIINDVLGHSAITMLLSIYYVLDLVYGHEGK